MFRKTMVVATVAAVAVLGGGTAALAAPTGPTGSGADAGQVVATATPGEEWWAAHAAGAVHGQVVVRTGDGQFVTHDFARGVVSGLAVATGPHLWVAVRTADGESVRFAVTGKTQVHLGVGAGSVPGVLKDLRIGDRVLITGVGSDTPTARHIFDAGRAPTTDAESTP